MRKERSEVGSTLSARSLFTSPCCVWLFPVREWVHAIQRNKEYSVEALSLLCCLTRSIVARYICNARKKEVGEERI
jgi:hypothetical protein